MRYSTKLSDDPTMHQLPLGAPLRRDFHELQRFESQQLATNLRNLRRGYSETCVAPLKSKARYLPIAAYYGCLRCQRPDKPDDDKGIRYR